MTHQIALLTMEYGEEMVANPGTTVQMVLGNPFLKML